MTFSLLIRKKNVMTNYLKYNGIIVFLNANVTTNIKDPMTEKHKFFGM